MVDKVPHQKSAGPLSTAQSSPRTRLSRIAGITFRRCSNRSVPSNHVHQHWYQRLRPHRPVSSTHCKNRAYILCSDESSSKQLRRCNSTASSPIGRVQCWEHRRQAINHRRRIVGSKVEVGMSQCECPSVVAVLQGRINRVSRDVLRIDAGQFVRGEGIGEIEALVELSELCGHNDGWNPRYYAGEHLGHISGSHTFYVSSL